MISKCVALDMLVAASKSGDPGTIELAAQLAGVAPCEICGFAPAGCHCYDEPKEYTPCFNCSIDSKGKVTHSFGCPNADTYRNDMKETRLTRKQIATLLEQSRQNFLRNFGPCWAADWIYHDIAELLDIDIK